MIKEFKKKLKQIINSILSNKEIIDNQNDIKLMIGKILANENNQKEINKSEFKVFSQFGEDGIINFIINNLKLKKNVFLEIGTENYQEANTRFLLENNNWSGAIIESNAEHIKFIKKQNYYWQRDLTLVNSFVTKENINLLIDNLVFKNDISLLSIDIDGNDYWVWKELELKPDIVVVEYNSRFGKEKSVTIPYDKNFRRPEKGKKRIYFGASLLALKRLGDTKGYALITTNSAGNNAFFIKKEHLSDTLREKSIDDCFIENTFSEVIGENNSIEKISKKSEKDFLFSLPLDEV